MNDLISRAEAIEHFMRLSEDESLSPITQTLMVGVSNELKKLPSAARSIGYWKDGKWCSVCGMPIATDVWGTSVDESEVHYCIECGAKMDGERRKE